MIPGKKVSGSIAPVDVGVAGSNVHLLELEDRLPGPPSKWPVALRTMALTCLHAQSPMALLWGSSLTPVCNKACLNLLEIPEPLRSGLSAKELFGNSWPEIEPVLKSVLNHGKSCTFKSRSNHQNSIQAVRGDFTCVLSPIYDDALFVSGIVILFCEDSETAAEIENLRRSEERYHKMIDEVKEYAIILLDKEGIIQNWNQGAETIKQYHESEVVGRHFEIFYEPEERLSGLPQRLLNEATINGKAEHQGWRLRKDHSKFWGSITLTALHNEHNEVIGFSKVTRDLTEQKKAEDQLRSFAKELQQRNEALKSSEDRYHKMIAEIQDYAIILLDEKGDIQNWNAGAEKIKGYTAQEIIGRHFRIFYPESDKENGLPERLLNEAVRNGKAIHEGWRIRKDGSAFWGSIVITALHASNGSIIGFSKVTRDLTERKAAEDKLKEYLRELELQNKELEQFAYVASHDLQEPLRKIRTFTSMVEQHLEDSKLSMRYLEKINVSAQRMSELIRSVLNYSRLTREGAEKSPVDLNQVLNNVLSDYELLVQEKDADIVCDPLPTIEAVPLQMNQLLSNLIGNALKFSDKKPQIKITSAIVDRGDIFYLPIAADEKSYLQISVADNGIGFEQQYEKLIFSMFQRLHGKHEYSGTGIGLALCKKIMENHDGFVNAKGTLGQGSTFYLYFPLKVLDSITKQTLQALH